MINNSKNKNIINVCLSALFLALCIVLPFFTGSIKIIGKALCPMHFPTMLCGMICGPWYGLAVGIIAPIMRSMLVGMPVMYPNAVGMAFELASYGFFCGLFYKVLPKDNIYLYINLIISMILGRAIWGAARFTMAGLGNSEFPLSEFIAGAVTDAIPGIILQIILIPIIIMLLRKAKLIR